MYPGCSLLILNVFIFALVYYQRDKKRAELIKAASQQQQQADMQSQGKYSEPPELLKSNSTTATSLHRSQSQISETHVSFNNTPSCQTNQGSVGNPQQQQSMSLSQRGILLSPSQAHSHHGNLAQSSHHHHHHHSAQNMMQQPQMLAVATLPRSNGGIGCLPKPPPPPRNLKNFSTLPHDPDKSSRQNLSYNGNNFDELKV